MIEPLLLARAKELIATLGPGLSYRDRDESSDPPADSQGRVLPFYSLFNLVAPPTPFALRRGGSVTASGSLQISLYMDSYTGAEAATELGRRIRALFPRLTPLGLARVEPLAYATSPLQEPPYIQVPITVPWRARVSEGDL